MKDIKSYLGRDWLAVQEGIRTYLGTDISLLNATNENLLSHGGKQLRPVIALLMARACGKGAANGDSVKFAVASELLHNATLLHDDVADESDERRGCPTVRKLMGPSVSVLVGDFWLVRAVRAILDANIGHDRAVALFAKTLGDLAEGEMLQLQKAGTGDTVMSDYMAIIYRKTASLFVAASLTAAISVGAPSDYEKAAEDFGTNMGYAFQMRDDIFDYMPDTGIGKPVGVDILEQKITLPLLGALGNVSADEQALIRKRIMDIDEDGRDYIIDFVHRNGGIEYAQGVLDEYVGRAKEALGVLPFTEERQMLSSLADYMAIRKI